MALDVPSSDTDSEPFCSSLCLPVTIEQRILYEIRVALCIHPHIRPDENMMSLQFCLEIQGFGRKDSVYATDLVADLPADFKQIVRSDQFIVHLLRFLCCLCGSLDSRLCSRLFRRLLSWLCRCFHSLCCCLLDGLCGRLACFLRRCLLL